MKHCMTLLALAFASLAFAQEPLPPFEEVDSNQDGQISRTEAAAVEGLDFDTADADQSGALDRTEYMAAASSQGEGGQSGDPGQPDAGAGGADPGAGAGAGESGERN